MTQNGGGMMRGEAAALTATSSSANAPRLNKEKSRARESGLCVGPACAQGEATLACGTWWRTMIGGQAGKGERK
jgi:hypothetical protein